MLSSASPPCENSTFMQCLLDLLSQEVALIQEAL